MSYERLLAALAWYQREEAYWRGRCAQLQAMIPRCTQWWWE